MFPRIVVIWVLSNRLVSVAFLVVLAVVFVNIRFHRSGTWGRPRACPISWAGEYGLFLDVSAEMKTVPK